MRITPKRFVIFLSLVLLAGLMLQQCWQRRSDAEKWLYFFDEPAREYAGRVLGPDRGTGLAPPESLSDAQIEIHEEEGYVVYSSAMFSGDGSPTLHMAFSPDGPPPPPVDRPGVHWASVGNAWYHLRPAP